MNDEEFDWKIVQEITGYTDEELEIFKSDPRRVATALNMIGRPEFGDQTVIIEVTSSKGCPKQLKPGDRLVFRRTCFLVTEKSDPWCIFAMVNIPMIAGITHERWSSGLDLKEIFFDHISCTGGCGVGNGDFGRVVMKGYVTEGEI